MGANLTSTLPTQFHKCMSHIQMDWSMSGTVLSNSKAYVQTIHIQIKSISILPNFKTWQIAYTILSSIFLYKSIDLINQIKIGISFPRLGLIFLGFKFSGRILLWRQSSRQPSSDKLTPLFWITKTTTLMILAFRYSGAWIHKFY
jgi:hypothetical protein